MSIKYTEKGNTVVEVGVRDMRVLHGPAPSLHAHCHVADLPTINRDINRRVKLENVPNSLMICGAFTYVVILAGLFLFLSIRHRQVLSHV